MLSNPKSKILLFLVYLLAEGLCLASQDAVETSAGDKSGFSNDVIQRSMDAALQEIERYRADLHRWDRVVRGFRSDHHLAVSFNYDRGAWQAEGDGIDRSVKINSRIVQASFLYTFHLRLWRGLGYYVGTKTGIGILEDNEVVRFEGGRYYQLPGLTAGFVWDLSPAFSIYSGLELSLMRIEDFSLDAFAVESSPALEPANVTARQIAYRFGLDFFFQLELGIRLEYGQYSLEYQRDRMIGLKRRGEIWTLGLVRHLI